MITAKLNLDFQLLRVFVSLALALFVKLISLILEFSNLEIRISCNCKIQQHDSVPEAAATAAHCSRILISVRGCTHLYV